MPPHRLAVLAVVLLGAALTVPVWASAPPGLADSARGAQRLDVVGTVPRFTTPNVAVLAPRVPGTVTIVADGTPVPELDLADGLLPDGLWFHDDGDGTATLGGTPTAPGTVVLVIRAWNGVGESEQELRVLVGAAPVLRGPTSASFTRGRPGTVTIAFAGEPSPVVALAPGAALPAWLSLTAHQDGTVTLAGTPTGRPATTVVDLSAGNAVGQVRVRVPVHVLPVHGACANVFAGTAGADRLHGSEAGDRLPGFAGADQLFGSRGADCLLGGAGRDGLWGDPGADVLRGGRGNDVVRGGRGADRMWGGPGDDRVAGSYGDDLLAGGAGADLVLAGPGDDVVRAADGVPDVVDCGRGRDRVVADRADRLAGCETVRYRSPRRAPTAARPATRTPLGPAPRGPGRA